MASLRRKGNGALAERNPSVASRTHPPMGFLFKRRHDVVKSFDVGGAHTLHDGSFQIGQMAADALGQLSPLGCWRDEESATIGFSCFALDQATHSQAVENTGQCRSFVREATMKIGNLRRRGMREECQNVRFALRQFSFAQVIEIEPEPMCRPVNWMNKMQWHRRKAVSGPAPSMKSARYRCKAALPNNVIGREQPKPLPAIGACGGEDDTLALSTFRRVDEAGCPCRRPFGFSHRPEK